MMKIGHLNPFEAMSKGGFHALRSIESLSPLRKIRGLILLAGSVRPSDLQMALGRSVLDLPVRAGYSLLDFWRAEACELFPLVESRPLSIRVILDRSSIAPALPEGSGQTIVAVERDPIEYRGTGGVLRDLAVGYGQDDYVLVATAAQLLEKPLAAMATALASVDADIALIAHTDHTPSGLMLVRCGCLRRIVAKGFIDMKEQALPRWPSTTTCGLCRTLSLRVFRFAGRHQYIGALRRHHHRLAGGSTNDPFQENWKATFSIVENPDDVRPGTRIHDSVVLRGAHVDEGAVVIGSVVCPGAIVRRGQMIVDQVVACSARGR